MFSRKALENIKVFKSSNENKVDIDVLVDNLLFNKNKNDEFFYLKKSSRLKITKDFFKEKTVKRVLCGFVLFLLFFALWGSSIPSLYSEFGSDFIVSLEPSIVYNGDTIWINVSVPVNYNISSLTVDMCVNDTVDLFLFDRTSDYRLWTGSWVVQNMSAGYYVARVVGLGFDNLSYSSSVEWRVLNETDHVYVNNTINESYFYNENVAFSELNLTILVNKDFYRINESVLISGIVLYNNSFVNSIINLFIFSPNYNSSFSLEVLDGRFDFEFVPFVVGNYVIQANLTYLNESISEKIVFYVFEKTVENTTLKISNLYVWDETDNQKRYQGDQIIFYANYSSDNKSIENASCLIYFNVGEWSLPVVMNYTSGLYIYNCSLNKTGIHEFRVECDASGFETKTIVDEFIVSEDISDVFIEDTEEQEQVYLIPGTSFYVERTINGTKGLEAVFAPLYSDGLTIEKFEIINKNIDSDENLLLRMDNSPRVFSAGKGNSIVEKKIDNLCESLPADLKQLNHVSYYKFFNLNNSFTIRVWFRAPSWDEIKLGTVPSSGHISYLTFTDNSYDFESSTWWNSNWNNRKLITINSSQVEDDLTNFPVLINITDTDLRDDAQDDGDDIAFVLYSDNSTKLNHEIELFNVTTGKLYAWINITSLSSSVDTKIWMYYNNSESSNQQNSTGVWDSNYIGVWHLNDLVTDESTSGKHIDSTLNKNNGSQNNNDDINGIIGIAQNFDGNDYINITSTSSLQITNAITLSGWINLRTFGAGSDVDPILRKGEANPNNYQLMITDSLSNFVLNGDDEYPIGTTSLSANTWYYIVGTWESGGSRIVYLNGTQDGTGTFTGPIPTDNRDLYIGGRADTDDINGILDEVRISNIARNISWIKTTYNNVINSSAFIIIEGEEYLVDTSVDIIFPYTVTYSPFKITAEGSSSLDNVTLYYRYSTDNSSWGSNVSWNNLSNPDTEFPWEWSFNFSNGTGYYEFYSIGNKSGFSDETPPLTPDAICYFNESLNTLPEIFLINPQPNGTINVGRQPMCQIWANDSDGDTLTVYLYENTTGDWVLRQTNASISADTIVGWVFSQASNYGIKYWWRVAVNDSNDNVSEWFSFTTDTINTSVDSIIPYAINTSPLTITASGDSDFDNVTLYYRYSQDNITWATDPTSIVWSPELLTNPSFETGDTTGWSNEGGGTMTVGTDCPWGSESPYEGMYYSYWLTAGENVNAYAYQNVSLESYASFIDAGLAKINVTGWLVSDEYHVPVWDEFFMNVKFYNASDENMSGYWYQSGGTNPISQGSGNNVDDWAQYGITNYTIPVGARKVQVSYFTWEYTGSTWYDAGSADNFSVKVGIEDYNWIEFGTDTNYQWSWNFNFPNGTGYYEFYSIGNKSGSPNETAPESADAICKYNRLPTITNEIPSNGSTNIQLLPQMNITINDADGDLMTITWYSNSSGSWQVFGTNSSVGNGTYHQINSNFSEALTNYWWYVNVSDGIDINTSGLYYYFTTGLSPPTIITNTSIGVEETNATLKGYLSKNGGEICTVRFEYGTTINYGTNTTNQTKSTGDEFSDEITSLTPGQIYHYRAYANNTFGSDTGTDIMFLTKPQPPTSLAAQTNNSDTIYLTWITGIGANNTYIERNTTGLTSWDRGQGTMIYNGSGAGYEDTGITQGTTYYYQAWSYATWTDFTTLHQWSDNNASVSNFTTYRPSIDLIIPSPNGTTRISLQPMCQIWANDSDSSILDIYWYENTTGDWVLRQTNASVNANSTYSWVFSQASNYGIKYWWRVAVNDSIDNVSVWFSFITEALNTSVDSISPYVINTSPLTITANNNTPVDNVTLYYRYNSNNNSWDINYNETMMNLNPDFRWVLDGDFTDEMGNLDGTGSEPPVYVDTIIPNNDHAQCGDFIPNDEMLVADDPLINTGSGYLGQQRSISVWFNADTIPTNTGNTIWSQGGGTNSITIYTYNDSGNTYVYCTAVEGTNIDYVRAEITTDVTYHLVVTYDFSGNEINLYINGSLADTDSSMAVGSSLSSHSGNIALGGQDANTDNHLDQSISNNFNGRIADLAYWSDGSVLSSSNISDIYTAGSTKIVWNEYAIDTSSPWSWNFDFPNGTGYYEFYSIGKKSGSSDESAPASADAICLFNRLPTITDEVPGNGSTNIQIMPQLSVSVNDMDGDGMNVTWYSNSSGSWQVFGINSSVGNGTYHQTNINFSSNEKTYWWYVTVTDGLNINTSAIFRFTTKSINTSVDDIVPYVVNAYPLYVFANGDNYLDNVTLWYRYSNDNSTWWNPNWQYRRRLNITNNNQTQPIEEGYSINFTVDTTGDKFLDSGNDVRIVYWNGTDNIELDRWGDEDFGGGWNSDNTIIWFKTQVSIPIDGYDDNYWIYYGYSQSGSPLAYWSDSMGADLSSKVFLAADDFEEHSVDESPDGWTSYSTGNVVVKDDDGNKVLDDGTGSGDNVVAGNSSWTNISVRQKFKSIDHLIDHAGVVIRWTDNSNEVYGGLVTNTTAQIWNRIGGSWTQIGGSWTISDKGNGWHVQELKIAGDIVKLYVDGSYIGSAKLSTGAPANGKSGFWCQYNNQGYRDNHIVRKYIDNEPSVLVDSEENSNWGIWIDTSNPDDNSPWSWNFDFPNGTGYYEFYSIGKKSGSSDESAPASADAICLFNRLPTITDEVPGNGSTNIQIMPQLSVSVNDMDGDGMNVTWYSNSSGSWQIFGVNHSVSNGTYYQINSNFSSPGTTYWWYVSVYDGVNTNNSGIFHFTTSYNPVVSNPGPSNGSTAQYLTPVCNVTVSDVDGGTVTVRFYENTTGAWILQQTNSSVDVTNPANVVWDNYSNATEDYKTYWWKVNVSDGKGCFAEVIYHFTTANTSIDITPDRWDQGVLQVGGFNSTSGFYFNLTNNRDTNLFIQIKASNATNISTGAKWTLSTTPSYDNFTLQYNKSGGGTWTSINLTYDLFVSSLDAGSWQTFDLKLIMATKSTTVDPLSMDLTFRSVKA